MAPLSRNQMVVTNTPDFSIIHMDNRTLHLGKALLDMTSAQTVCAIINNKHFPVYRSGCHYTHCVMCHGDNMAGR